MAVRLNCLIQARKYQEKVWNKNVVLLVQCRITTVKTIAANWFFILQPIKAIQLIKHTVCGVLLEGMFCSTWLADWEHFCCFGDMFGCWISFFFYLVKFCFFFFILGQISFFSYLTYTRGFSFFEGKSYPLLMYELTYTRKCTVLLGAKSIFLRSYLSDCIADQI